ncbi:hypothetical protein JTB14_016285 [Gonioctena quinquepunctata]|nr:hypothetical protein JTB14_016285 [Gonioctena quinquepunctata]
MIFMSFFTAIQRIKYRAFANEEDTKKLQVKVKVDQNVERVRRAHLNDLENIPLFFFSAFIYLMTDPSEYVAKILFLVYTAARIAHTVVYAVVVVPQPARALSFGIGTLIIIYMTVRGIIHFKFFKCFILAMLF